MNLVESELQAKTRAVYLLIFLYFIYLFCYIFIWFVYIITELLLST